MDDHSSPTPLLPPFLLLTLPPPPPQAVAEKESVEEFVRSGNDLFTRQAASVEDIGKAGQEARGMVDGLVTVAQV